MQAILRRRRRGISPRFRLHSQGPSIAKESRLGTGLLLVARPVVMFLGIGIPVAIKYHLNHNTFIDIVVEENVFACHVVEEDAEETLC